METFQWPQGKCADLKVYAADDPQRKPTEDWFADNILQSINDVRRGVYRNAWLLAESLKEPNSQNNKFGFQTWLWAIEAVLGAETCCQIGKKVCEEQNYTLEEAKQHYEDQRKQEALSLGLSEDAGWKEINKAYELMSRHDY